ncbi:MAG: alanine dehydrogenase [Marinicaulis sp.]|nr:alanine dehydrogenase [Marinicaulis sp.]NNL89101.1 alanine dehydrogenase [Marinicaulis sp.]
MRVGVPKEIKNSEFRVGLVPGSVREYVANGHEVLIETNAGAGIKVSDSDYEAVGAKIAPDAKSIFEASEMIVKVKEPQPSEWVQLRDDQILYTYLHLAPDPDQARGLMESGVTAVAYETVTDPYGGLPLLAPMSEVAGRLSIQAAAYALTAHQGGRGLLMGGVPGVLPAKVLVIGGGVVGTHAARMAIGLGADVTILDRSNRRLAELDDLFQGRAKTRYSTYEALDEETDVADVVVGAVLIPGASAPKLVTREMLKGMKEGAVLVDVAIDQGGCFETSRATTHEDPTYVVEKVIHYCVANMPGAVPLTSSHALNNATLQYGLMLANSGLDAMRENKYLRDGLNIHRGKVTYRAVAEALNVDFTPAGDALG